MRNFILFLCVFFSSSIIAQNQFNPQIEPLLDTSLKPFYFGVASGDPQQNSVVIWTKILPDNFEKATVNWQVATDTLMQNIVASGVLVTDSLSAYTIKLVAIGLQPNQFYFYRFSYKTIFSPIGRTKTAPVNEVTDLKFAVVSCSNYQNGFFNAYRLLANRNDLNAIIHLGDYIYEGGIGHSKKKPQIRNHIPEYEILNLQDYRSRYAQYRLDKDLMEAHRLHPFITVWDDHEFANNAYKEGAGNHQAKEGEWEVRKEIAKKVYFEWLPITDNVEESIVRELKYGNLADIFMLDGRTEGRSKQIENPADSNLNNPNRTMLGKTQADWLIQGIENSKSKWKVIGNQVVFSELDAHKLSKKHARLTDSWDGYPAERKVIMDSFYQYQIKNIIILTGDIHTSWAFDLVQNPQNENRYNRKTGMGVIGAEFVAPSVSSANLDERAPRAIAKLAGSLIKDKSMNPHLRFNDMINHGYVLVDLDEIRAKATWVYTETVKEKTDKFSSKNSWETKYNQNRLVKSK